MMSYVDPEGVDAPATGAARVGAELRAARLRLGWALPDIAASLRIRLPYLEALEEGRLSDLPGAAYAVGFVRSYATLLGLDAEEVARRFREEARHLNRKTELTFPVPVPQRGVPPGAVVLLGILIAALAYAGWYRWSGSDVVHQADVAAPPPDRLAALAPQPQVQSPQVASILPSSPTPPAAAPQAAAPVAIPTPAVPVPVPVPVSIAPPAPTAAPAPAVTSRFMLRSKTGGFLLVKERLGRTLLRRALQPGETWAIPTETDLQLTTGNAGGVELLVDGRPVQTLGAPGAVLNDAPLDPLLARAAKASSTSTRPAR